MQIIDMSSTIQTFETKGDLAKSLLDRHYPVQIPNVFEIDSGITHWVVAGSFEQCKEFIINRMELEDEDIEGISISICDEERLCKLKFKDDDGTVRSMKDEWILQTGSTMPYELACSEY